MAEISRFSIGSGLFALRFAENLLRLPDGQYAIYSRGRTRHIGTKQDVLEADFLLCTLTDFHRINLLALAAIVFPTTFLTAFVFGSVAVSLSVILSCTLFFFFVTRRNLEEVLFSDLGKGTDLGVAGSSTLRNGLSCIRHLQSGRMRVAFFLGVLLILTIGFDLYDKRTGISWDRLGDTIYVPLAISGLLFAIGLHGLYGRFLGRSAAQDFENRHGVPLTRASYLAHELQFDPQDPVVAEAETNKDGLKDSREQEARLKRLAELIPLLSPMNGMRYRLAAGRRDFALTADEIAGLAAGWTEFQPDKVFLRKFSVTAIATGGLLLLLMTSFRSENLLLIYAGILTAVAVAPVIQSIIEQASFLSGLRQAVHRLYPNRELDRIPVAERYPPAALNPFRSLIYLPLAFGVPILMLVCFDLWFCFVHGSCSADFAAQQAGLFRPVEYRYLDVAWAGLRFDMFLSATAVAGLITGAGLCFVRYLGVRTIRQQFHSSFGAPLTAHSYLYRKLRFPISYREIAEREPPGKSQREV